MLLLIFGIVLPSSNSKYKQENHIKLTDKLARLVKNFLTSIIIKTNLA